MPQAVTSKRITQKDFANLLRTELPELKDFSDSQIVNKVLERRPELRTKIENPLAGDVEAEAAQNKAINRSKSAINPAFWENHPLLKQIARGASNMLPGVGMLAGGALATPETMGTGTIVGGSAGAASGRLLRDAINELSGLEPRTSNLSKVGRAAIDAGITAVTPGAIEIIKAPVQSARIGAGMLSNLEDSVLPRGISKFIKSPFLEDFAAGGKPPMRVSSPIASIPEIQGEVANPVNKGFTEGEIINPINNNPAMKRLNQSPTSFYTDPSGISMLPEDYNYRQSINQDLANRLSTKSPWATPEHINMRLGIEPAEEAQARIVKEMQSKNTGPEFDPSKLKLAKDKLKAKWVPPKF